MRRPVRLRQLTFISICLCGTLVGMLSFPVFGRSEDEHASPAIDKSMSLTKAQHELADLVQKQWDLDGFITIRDTHVSQEALSYELERKHRWGGGMSLGGILSQRMKPGVRTYSFSDMPYLNVPPQTVDKNHWCVFPRVEPHNEDFLCWDSKSDAELFVTSMNRMIWENSPQAKSTHEAAEQAFRQAAAWRANGSKVALPEEADHHRVLAEEAFREKNFQKAANEYEAALQIYPTWPAGQYNLALIQAEQKQYPEAIQHMQIYLELVPDAPDAQKVNEQIWIWQDKEKN